MAWMGQLIERCRQRFPQTIAVIDGEREVTFAQLEDRTARLASALLERGIRKGDRVGILARNRLEVFEAYFALGRIGAAFVPINHTSVQREMLDIVQRCRVSAVMGEADLLPMVAEAKTPLYAFEEREYAEWTQTQERSTLPNVEITDLMAILHTSATTGQSKGVMVDYRSLRSMATGFLADVGPEPGMVFFNCFQLCHGALVQPFIYMVRGATVVVQRGFTAQGCLEELERTRTTHLWVVPEMLKFIMRSRKLDSIDLSSLRQVAYAAAPLPLGLLREAHQRLRCGFRQIYGMTEGGGPMATLGPEEHAVAFAPDAKPDTVVPAGRVICGTSMRISSESGDPLPPREIGEVCVRGDGVMLGYWENPAATDEVIRDGWLRTGDLGYLDEAGYVYLVGRLKEMIMRSGQQVFPVEVEKVLLEHPAIAEAGVVGIADPDWGETPVAFLVVRPGSAVTADEVNAFLVDRLASYKRPSRIEFVQELPRGMAGKLLRRVLKERAMERAMAEVGA